MNSTYTVGLVSLVDAGRGKFEIEFTRDEAEESWRITMGSVSLGFPANFHTDKRTVREFARDFQIMMWPTSGAANVSRQHRAESKKNRRQVM
jgi:hypothetical protein